MAVYADSDFYTNEYSGVAGVTASHLLKASQIIDLYTFGNVKDDVPESVRMCCCEVAEILQKYDSYAYTDKSGRITSEKVGDLAMSYEAVSVEKVSAQRDKEIRSAIYRWLANTGLLYRGVRSC